MTIAEQLKITEFPFIIKDSRCNVIYREDSDKYWVKREFDLSNNQTSFLDSENFSYKQEFDSRGNEIYWEDSNGTTRDNRPKSIPEYTMEDWLNVR